jgi:hypothetical protein
MGSGERKGKETFKSDGGLFRAFMQKRPRKRLLIPKIFAERSQSFRRAVSLSVALHLLVGLILFVPTMFSPASEIGGNREALARAAAVLEAEKPGEADNFQFGSEDIPGELVPFLRLETQGSGLLDREKFQLFKKLLQTYLEQNKGQTGRDETVAPDELIRLLSGKDKLRLDSGKQVFAFPSSSGPGLQIKTIDPGRQNQIDYLQRAQATQKNFFVEGQNVRIRTDNGIQIVPAGYFFRSCPYDELMALGPSLFHVIDGFPSFPGSTGVFNIEKKNKTEEAASHPLIMPVRIVSGFLGESVPEEADDSSRNLTGPSDLDEIKKQQILDELMVFREREQLERFFKIHLQGLDPNTDEAASFVRRFLYGNLSNVFLFISDISSTFDYLEELYYNRELKHTLLSLLQTYLETRVGTEILLYFAAQYSFESRALEHLYETYSEAKKFLKQKYFKAEVHEKKAKLYVITQIYEDLQKVFRRPGLETLEAVVNRYKSEEAGIYSLLIQRGGSDKSHGLFALGRLYWKNQQHELAFSTWDLIPLDYSSKALMEIRDVISSTTKIERAFPMITAILDYYSNINVRQHLARLVRFGKWDKRQK